MNATTFRGSTPGSVSIEAIRKFNNAFAPHHLPATAFKPSYGIAEATLFVSTIPAGEPPKIVYVDRDELNKHRFVEVPADSPNAVAQASAGKIGVAEWVTIVDTETATELPDGQIGETTPAGAQVATMTLDATGTPPGSGALFGLALTPDHRGVYFVDDATNTLNLLH